MIKRDLGKISFATVQDDSGQIQIVLQDKETPKNKKDFFKKYVDAGDFIGVEGSIIKTKTGQISILVKKSIKACLKMKTKTLLIGGGVAANAELRNQLKKEASKHNIETFFPKMSFCTDNAAMIAGLGFHELLS